MNPRSILSWVLIVPVAALFVLTGVSKLGGSSGEMFIDWGYPAWFAFVIGGLEAVGGIALVAPRAMKWGVYLLTTIMIGAAVTHIANAEGLAVLRPAIFAGVMWAALLLRRSSSAALDPEYNVAGAEELGRAESDRRAV